MNGAVVKFDALPDADRTGAEYDDGTLAPAALLRLLRRRWSSNMAYALQIQQRRYLPS